MRDTHDLLDRQDERNATPGVVQFTYYAAQGAQRLCKLIAWVHRHRSRFVGLRRFQEASAEAFAYRRSDRKRASFRADKGEGGRRDSLDARASP
jgi:hypothetical protein